MGQTMTGRPVKEIRPVKEMLQTCIQCGTCSASCPNAPFMDITPRHMWRLLLTDHAGTLFSSRSFILCSSCYTCTLRCPRGLELTVAMSRLKQAASKLKLKQFHRSICFYDAFLDSVKKYGRVREMELMRRYFMSMKNPLLPFGYASLGVKLLSRRKVWPQFSFGTNKKLAALFDKTAELEG